MRSRFSPVRTVVSFVGAVGLLASGFAVTNNVVSAAPAAIFSEDFNSIVQGYTGTQAHTGLTLGAWDSLTGWTWSGVNAVHDVDRILGAGKDIAVSFYNNNEITLTTGFAANTSGVVYTMTFEVGPSVWAGASQASDSTDGLIVSLLRANGTTVASTTQLAGAWNGTATAQDAMTSRTFVYTGDGTGVVRIKVSNINPSADRFGGAIDNIVVTQGAPACTPTTSTSGADTIVSFTSTGPCSWVVPTGVTSVRYLVVGGGGGGGSDNGGGGGAGGYSAGSSLSVVPGSETSVVVGNGGAGAINASSTASNGGDSTLSTVTSRGGGGGGSIDNTAGADGGSAGGRAANRSQIAQSAIATTTPLQGNNGGGKNSGGFGGGGGGGASAAGVNGGSNIGGNGGAGQTNNITGANVTYAGGGGGGGDSNTAGTGGTGGGGNGSRRGDEIPTQGADGLGGGGGAAGGSVAGGLGKRGGSGIVIVRYTTPAAPTNTSAPVISGTTRTGATLSIVSDAWTGSPTSYTYQWKRASSAGGTYSNIGSATSSTYVLTDDDINKYIKVSVVATNGIGSSSAELSAASSIVTDLPDSLVPTVTTSVSTATGFTFTISNYSASYTYALTTTKGTVSRSTDDVTVTGLTAGESATVTIAVTRANYKPASKTVTGSATPATTTTSTTAAPALSIVIQAPVTTVAQGQASVATIAPTTSTLPVLGANGLPIPTTTTTTIAPAKSRTVATSSTLPPATTTTVGPPVVDKVDAGQTAVQVDGVKTDATVTRENNQMVVTAGSVSATLSGADSAGKTLPLDTDGTVHLSAGDVIKVSVGGFKPGSLVEVWLFSTPTQLGTAVVGADGTVSGTYRLPAGTKSGTHRVVVTARLANGKSTSFTLGILVGDISTTSTLTRVLIAIPIALAIGFGFLLPNQLRRRRKLRTA
jgi:hypothetical protein